MMGIFKKRLFSPLLLLTFFAAIPAQASSQLQTIITTTTEVIRNVLLFVMTLAIVIFGWGIVTLISAAGSPERVKKAKAIIWWGLIGITVLASLAGIVTFFQIYFGIEGGGAIKVPQF